MKITQRYIYPPRPRAGAIPPTELANFRTMGWQGQLKFNGNRLILSRNSTGITFYNRHQDVHKRYDPPAWLQKEIAETCQFLGLSDDEWNLLDGELLHNKHKLFRDTLAIWDILVRDGEWLLGTTYQERYDSLISKAGNIPYVLQVGSRPFAIGIKITEHIFLPFLVEDLEGLWDLTQRVNTAAGWEGTGEPVLEGVVLKFPRGKLEPGLRPVNNSSWQQRCRVETGRHRY